MWELFLTFTLSDFFLLIAAQYSLHNYVQVRYPWEKEGKEHSSNNLHLNNVIKFTLKTLFLLGIKLRPVKTEQSLDTGHNLPSVSACG